MISMKTPCAYGPCGVEVRAEPGASTATVFTAYVIPSASREKRRGLGDRP